MDLKVILGTALMMFMRIKALYYNQKVVLGFVALVGLASFITNAYSLTSGVVFVHNPESDVHGKTLCLSAVSYSCIVSKPVQWFTCTFLPLIYDENLTLLNTLRKQQARILSYKVTSHLRYPCPGPDTLQDVWVVA